LFKMEGTKLQMSSPFHPQSNDQSEVVNRVITMYLRCLGGDRPRSWLQWLPSAEFCYNSVKGVESPDGRTPTTQFIVAGRLLR
jgi:hypothetical protein